MAFNLLDSVKELFTSDLISKAASSLGEGEGGTAKAISGIIPSVLGGIVSKATSGIDGASSILDMAKGSAGTGILSNLGNIFGGGGGSSLLSNGLDMVKRLLGDKFSSIASTISNFAGIKESSVSSLMGMVAPAALGVVGQHASQNNLTPNSLSNMLAGQAASLKDALPSGLSSLAGLTGLSSVGSAISSMTGDMKRAPTATVHTAAYTAKTAGSNKRRLLPLLLAVLVIVVVWLLSRSCNKEVAATAPMTDTSAAVAAIPAGTGPVSIKVKLPDGTELDAYKGGIEDGLVAYLNS